jgi:formate hydrogenlyase subunit 6/NADH:ubiquinone oxidoreductase subunit I
MPFDVFDRILRPLRRGVTSSPYPLEPPRLPAAARGLPELDTSRCDGSADCVRACPTGAIRLVGASWSLDAGACIFCARCAQACPRAAIRIGSQVLLAVRDREDLVIRETRSGGPE